MKKKLILLGIILLNILVIGGYKTSTVVQASTDILTDKYEPTGVAAVKYPQVVIRTNRYEKRTDLDSIITNVNNVVNEYPEDDSAARSKAAIGSLNTYFNSGNIGHVWIIVFNSSKSGDYTSYAYHGNGYIKNGPYDTSERKFHQELAVNVKSYDDTRNLMEGTYIPKLNSQSYSVGKMMNLSGNATNGSYTPINNCAWFAGELFNQTTGENLVYAQPINGQNLSSWGMPYLANISQIADPGMVSESIEKDNEKKCFHFLDF
ncbi:hypothetical protein [Lactobacillus terrae]|uniref:hypothetical protein n=1 Tax=Lactobacillus terrae TaxID=2269374 RepID=UPI000C1B7C85|nr:hypothetical protein [Lactobacillus terrae]